MAELKELLRNGLERFDPAPDRGFERTLARVRRRQRNRRIGAGLLALALFAATVTGIWAALRREHRTVPAGPFPRVTITVPIPGGPADVAIGREGVWIATREGAVRIDPSSGEVIATVHTAQGSSQRAIAVGEGSVLLLGAPDHQPALTSLGTVNAVDPTTGRAVALTVQAPTDLAAGGGALWVLAGTPPEFRSEVPPMIRRLDASTLRGTSDTTIESQPGRTAHPTHIAFGEGSLWLASDVTAPNEPDQVIIDRIDPDTGELAGSINQIEGSSGLIAAGAGGVWVAVEDEGGGTNVQGFDPASHEPIAPAVHIGMAVGDISAAGSGVWLAARDERVVWRIDPVTGTLDRSPVRVAGVPLAVAADHTGAWVVGSGRAFRIDACAPAHCPQPHPTSTSTSPGVEDVTIHESTESLPASFPFRVVTGRHLLPEGDTCSPVLAADAAGTLYGWIAPVAVPSPDGTLIGYNTWTPGGGRLGGTPSIRVRSVGCGGRDFVYADDAASFAWRSDGQFAYFQITGEDAGGLPIGQVYTWVSPEILSGPTPPPVPAPQPWTKEAARWIVAAWAQDRILAYQELEGEALRLFVLDGPGEIRSLGPPGQNMDLVAVSQDGSQAFVSLGEAKDVVAVYDLKSGDEVARLDMTGFIDPETDSSYSVGYAGSWNTQQVVAPGGPGMLTFLVDDAKIELTGAFRIEDGIQEPQLILSAEFGARVVGWQHLNGSRRSRWLDCNLIDRDCVAGPASGTQLYLVHNPSRPAKG